MVDPGGTILFRHRAKVGFEGNGAGATLSLGNQPQPFEFAAHMFELPDPQYIDAGVQVLESLPEPLDLGRPPPTRSPRNA